MRDRFSCLVIDSLEESPDLPFEFENPDDLREMTMKSIADKGSPACLIQVRWEQSNRLNRANPLIYDDVVCFSQDLE